MEIHNIGQRINIINDIEKDIIEKAREIHKLKHK